MPVDPTAPQPQAPKPRGIAILAKLLLVIAAVLALGEISWRLTGTRPVQGDLPAFAQYRRDIRNSSAAVALIGSSRVLCDIDPKILQHELPDRTVYQLGISGTSALPMLENLAQDQGFRGRVLCEFHLSYATDLSPFPERDAAEANWQRYVHFMNQRPYVDFVATWFTETLRPYSALVEAKDKDKDFAAAIMNSLKARLSHRAGTRDAVAPLADARPREDRFLALFHRGNDNSGDAAVWADLMRKGVKDPDDRMQHIAAWVDAIRSRGGDVIMLRMPVSGSLKDLEDQIYPSDAPFRFLADHKITLVDTTKEPTLNHFDCPDDSHLDAGDAEIFSAALGRILKDRRLLDSMPVAANRMPQ
jgi:hypothetical protein